jgi:hypothetical protein
MYKASAASIDADVVDMAGGDPEEHPIPRPQLAARHRPGHALLIASGARNIQSDGFMRIDSQPAAIKAVLIRATELIGRADQRHRDSRDRVTLLMLGLWRHRQARCAAASGDEQNHRGADGNPQSAVPLSIGENFLRKFSRS